MYLLAIVLALWGVGNLVAGDYVEGVAGVAIAGMLGAGQYFWDALGGDGVWQRLKIPLAVAVMLAGLGVVALMLLEEVEIGAEHYVRLEQAVSRFPVLKRDAARAISDGKVSVVEYHALEQQYEALAKQHAVDFLADPGLDLDRRGAGPGRD